MIQELAGLSGLPAFSPTRRVSSPASSSQARVFQRLTLKRSTAVRIPVATSLKAESMFGQLELVTAFPSVGRACSFPNRAFRSSSTEIIDVKVCHSKSSISDFKAIVVESVEISASSRYPQETLHQPRNRFPAFG